MQNRYNKDSFKEKGGNRVSDRQAALEMALKQIEKQFGKGSIMKLGEQSERQISTVPSGSLALDVALGVGGYPRGRIIEIYGERIA
jgi:recombination protein RecA